VWSIEGSGYNAKTLRLAQATNARTPESKIEGACKSAAASKGFGKPVPGVVGAYVRLLVFWEVELLVALLLVLLDGPGFVKTNSINENTPCVPLGSCVIFRFPDGPLTARVMLCWTLGSNPVFEKSEAQVKLRDGRTPSTSVALPSSVTV